jgi:hypothetical protein
VLPGDIRHFPVHAPPRAGCTAGSAGVPEGELRPARAPTALRDSPGDPADGLRGPEGDLTRQRSGYRTGEPGPGVKVLIPLERLSAIEDVTILLYGRLSFVSFSQKLTIRYNTLARAGLKPALQALRERLAGPPLPLPPEEPEIVELPLKWRRLLRSPQLRFREGAPVAYRFAVTPRSSRDDIDRAQLLVLNPHELLYLRDPLEASHNYGEDSLIVPRPRITRVRAREKYLEVASNGSRLSLTMAPELREAAARWLS